MADFFKKLGDKFENLKKHNINGLVDVPETPDEEFQVSWTFRIWYCRLFWLNSAVFDCCIAGSCSFVFFLEGQHCYLGKVCHRLSPPDANIHNFHRVPHPRFWDSNDERSGHWPWVRCRCRVTSYFRFPQLHAGQMCCVFWKRSSCTTEEENRTDPCCWGGDHQSWQTEARIRLLLWKGKLVVSVRMLQLELKIWLHNDCERWGSSEKKVLTTPSSSQKSNVTNQSWKTRKLPSKMRQRHWLPSSPRYVPLTKETAWLTYCLPFLLVLSATTCDSKSWLMNMNSSRTVNVISSAQGCVFNPSQLTAGDPDFEFAML